MKITEKVYEVNASGNNVSGETVKYLNGIGQITKEEARGANNVWDIVETEYTNLGEVKKQTRPYRTGQTKQWTTITYDIQGRTKKIDQPDGSYQEAFYNEATRPIRLRVRRLNRDRPSGSLMPGDVSGGDFVMLKVN